MCDPYLRFAFIQRDCHSNISLQRVSEACEQLLNWSWFSLPRPLHLRLSHAIEHAPSQAFWKKKLQKKKIGLLISWAYYRAESFIANILGPYKYSSGKSFPPGKVFKLLKLLNCSKSYLCTQCPRFQEAIVSTYELDISVFMSLNCSGRNHSKNDPYRHLQKFCATCFY